MAGVVRDFVSEAERRAALALMASEGNRPHTREEARLIAGSSGIQLQGVLAAGQIAAVVQPEPELDEAIGLLPSDLVVAPSHRGRGLARSLVEAAGRPLWLRTADESVIDQATARGLRVVVLDDGRWELTLRAEHAAPSPRIVQLDSSLVADDAVVAAISVAMDGVAADLDAALVESPQQVRKREGARLEGAEGWTWLVVEDGDVIALARVDRTVAPETVLWGLTWVHPDRRRRGLALELKRHGYAVLWEAGIRRVLADHAPGNEAIIGVDRRLGFVPTHDWAVRVGCE
jgi:GNAT superfamily N-acetyltransferase